MDKVLTISVAAYNVEKYIGTLIDSVIGSQAAGKIEIIVVDDGSKDKTSDIVKTYCNKCDSVRLVTKENGGYGSTINRALEIAEGKYFRLLDGDDVVQTEVESVLDEGIVGMDRPDITGIEVKYHVGEKDLRKGY